MQKVMQTAGGTCKNWNTKMYSIPLLKNDGQVVWVVAMGMGKITEELKFIDHLPAVDLFPAIESWRLRRPHSAVDLLIGIGMRDSSLPLRQDDISQEEPKGPEFAIWIRFPVGQNSQPHQT